MSNHVHLLTVPWRADSLARAARGVIYRYMRTLEPIHPARRSNETGRAPYILKIVLVALFYQVFLTGCISHEGLYAGGTFEKMTPEGVYVGPNGDIAIKTTSTYYRHTYWKFIRPNFMWMFGKDWDDCRTTVALNRAPASRFVVISSDYIKTSARNLKSSDTCVIKSLDISEDCARIIPKHYLGASASIGDLTDFQTSKMAPLNQSILIAGDRPLAVDLTRLQIKSSRESYKPWVYVLDIPLYTLDWAENVVTFAGYIALNIVFFPFT